MIKPTVHLNGTSAQALFDGYREAGHAVRAAIEAVCLVYPHGRDYYVQGTEQVQAAVREHEARAAALRAILKDIDELIEHVLDTAKPGSVQ